LVVLIQTIFKVTLQNQPFIDNRKLNYLTPFSADRLKGIIFRALLNTRVYLFGEYFYKQTVLTKANPPEFITQLEDENRHRYNVGVYGELQASLNVIRIFILLYSLAFSSGATTSFKYIFFRHRVKNETISLLFSLRKTFVAFIFVQRVGSVRLLRPASRNA